jgi:cytochrome c
MEKPMMKKKLIIVATVSLFTTLSGAALASNATAGKARYAVCGGCHGPTGLGNPMLGYPKLAGQSATDIAGKLRGYKSGERNNVTMRAMTAGLTEADIENIAAYIATLK